ncbi:zinc finger C-x8-C-x5-C-x3-H type family protein [Artemisia annua]|uniref:Zinc finger C-x8-C-x5-C-x3-H type family protein n=1 Tax=Artemisia annua TaxID=35608 RepID=A0A2U1NXJ0_ARTAN|nr:zinc finger C-x8-C-x5-C-x3-H type family protein [Artemisia annua]
MPPKQSKSEIAKKQKIVEDKTFGLKNKNKSKNVQKYVQSLHQNVQPKPDPSKLAAKKRKEEEKAREKELNDLFKVAVVQPKVPIGVDPKSILCEFFKAGQCAKGFKCKFSHDLNVQRKGEKIDIFSDKRDEGTMEDWDQETLEKVVASKGKEYNQNKPTDIVCKHFLEAVEKKQYGWFWVCPNGGKQCHYRHALPPGYILKSQMKALLEEESNKLAIEEEIEDQVIAVYLYLELFFSGHLTCPCSGVQSESFRAKQRFGCGSYLLYRRRKGDGTCKMKNGGNWYCLLFFL